MSSHKNLHQLSVEKTEKKLHPGSAWKSVKDDPPIKSNVYHIWFKHRDGDMPFNMGIAAYRPDRDVIFPWEWDGTRYHVRDVEFYKPIIHDSPYHDSFVRVHAPDQGFRWFAPKFDPPKKDKRYLVKAISSKHFTNGIGYFEGSWTGEMNSDGYIWVSENGNKYAHGEVKIYQELPGSEPDTYIPPTSDGWRDVQKYPPRKYTWYDIYITDLTPPSITAHYDRARLCENHCYGDWITWGGVWIPASRVLRYRKVHENDSPSKTQINEPPQNDGIPWVKGGVGLAPMVGIPYEIWYPELEPSLMPRIATPMGYPPHWVDGKDQPIEYIVSHFRGIQKKEKNPVPTWIECSKRPPKDGGEYWVYVPCTPRRSEGTRDKSPFHKGIFDKKGDKWNISGFMDWFPAYEVTHYAEMIHPHQDVE